MLRFPKAYQCQLQAASTMILINSQDLKLTNKIKRMEVVANMLLACLGLLPLASYRHSRTLYPQTRQSSSLTTSLIFSNDDVDSNDECSLAC